MNNQTNNPQPPINPPPAPPPAGPPSPPNIPPAPPAPPAPPPAGPPSPPKPEEPPLPPAKTTPPTEPITPPVEKPVPPPKKIAVDVEPEAKPEPPSPTASPSSPPGKIEVNEYNPPLAAAEKKDQAKTPLPPIKQSGSGKAVSIVAGIAVAFLAVGFLSGFLGYRYLPGFKNMFSSSANIEQESEEASTGSPQSTKTEPSDVSAWPTYSNTKYSYSIKYPDTWYNQGADDPTSKTVQFSSFKPEEGSSATLSGYKVEIVFQDANNKNLKDWVEANNTVVGEEAAIPTKIQVSGQEAYQQTNNGINKSVSTYLLRTDKIMVITYYGPENKFDEGKSLYDKILDSIKLT